jgi:hypothetical protein
MITAPLAPKTIAETGLEPDTLQKLLAKTLHLHGTMTPSALSRELCLPITVVSQLIGDMQRLQLIEARGLAGADMRSELRYALGGAGIPFALEAMGQSKYVGPAPITLDAFHAQIQNQSITGEHIHRAELVECLNHLVLPGDLVDRLGPAINSAKSILFYGAPGNGKTSIAEAIGTAFKDVVYLPHCIEVGGQFIRFFDTTVHAPVEEAPAPAISAMAGEKKEQRDMRWVACHRPVILTGGELTLHMLDLMYNPVSNFYEAPIHLKAVGGIFIVDDFGRQQTNPQAILNRWIIPLERKYDFLTLHTGKKFSIPFDQLVIFSTNIEPKQLADSAGLRRLYYKLNIPVPTLDDFRKIFISECKARQIFFNEDLFAWFLKKFYIDPGNDPAGHHPKYVLDYIGSVCSYRDTPVEMSEELLSSAWENLHIS